MCWLFLQRLAISLPDLVDAAPSLTADGSIILGRRESKVFLLDKLTGRSVSTISNAADALEDHSGALGERHNTKNMGNRHAGSMTGQHRTVLSALAQLKCAAVVSRLLDAGCQLPASILELLLYACRLVPRLFPF